jgi:hypothetical protein
MVLLLAVVLTIFAGGFSSGYFVRAAISRKRRREATRRLGYR